MEVFRGLQRFLYLSFAALSMLALPLGMALVNPALAADPVKVGFSMSLSGPGGPAGKQVLVSLEIWRDDVNAKGGLLGRPVELVYYDDQTSPANVPPIYAKLIDVDKVDLLLGPYATNQIAAAIAVLTPRKLTTIGLLGLAANSQFHYPGYFSMLTYGENPAREFSRGFFELAKSRKPQLKTVAIGDQLESRRIGIGRFVLCEQHVEIVEFGPVIPEGRRAGLRAFGGEHELRGRRRRAILGVDEIAIFRLHMQHLLAGYRECRCH